MIVWVNGMSGVGKRAVAQELVRLLPGGVLFDPAQLGGPLSGVLPRLGTGRLEDSPAWRKVVADTAAALLNEVPGPLVVPTELLGRQNRDEIFGLIAGYGLTLHHVLLDAEETILRARVNGSGDGSGDGSGADGAGRAGGADGADGGGLAAYREALPWLRADAFTVDVGRARPAEAARRIAEAVGAGLTRCEIVRTPKRDGDTVAAAVLLFDTADRVLLVDPTYKAGWEFPGGVVENGEPPSVGAARELAEELGLECDPGGLRLLLVDWEAAPPGRRGGLRLVFDGGVLDAADAAGLRLPAAELRGRRFVTAEEAAGLLPEQRARRLAAALKARAVGRIGYVEPEGVAEY